MKKRTPKKRTTPKKAEHKKRPLEGSADFQWRPYLLLTLLVAAVMILYAPTLNYPFQFDDNANILKNTSIRISSATWENFLELFEKIYRIRPVGMFSFALNYLWGGYDPFGYHLVNMLIHAVNGLLLFVFLRWTLAISGREIEQSPDSLKSDDTAKNGWDEIHHSVFLIPFLAAAIWLFHPLATNTVTYIVQRLNSLATCFYLLSLLCYIRGRTLQLHIGLTGLNRKSVEHHNGAETARFNRRPLLWFGGCGLLALLSVLTKEIAGSLPAVILFYEIYFFPKLGWQWWKKNTVWLLFAISALFLLFGTFVGFGKIVDYFQLYDKLEFTMSQRLLTQFRVVILYLSLILYPAPGRMNVDHDVLVSTSLTTPLTTLLSIIAVSGMLIAAVCLSKRSRIISFSLLWYFLTLSIESSILPLDLMFEHRTYLPSMMVVFCLVHLFFSVFRRRLIRLAVPLIIVALFTYWTSVRNTVWSDPVRLWQDSISKSPHKSRPYINLAESYADNKDYERAINQYKKALAINPYSDVAHFNIGSAYYIMGKLEAAIAHYRQALHNNPDMAEAHNNLGVALIDQNKLEEGIFHYKKALRLMPNHPEAPGNLKKAQRGLIQINNKIRKLQLLLQTDPQNPHHYYMLGFLNYRKGRFDLSMENYQKALSIDASYEKALVGLAELMAVTKKEMEAVGLLKRLAMLAPENGNTYYNIACLYARQDNIDEALAWLQKALDKGFDNQELMATDRDLEKVRKTDAYRRMVERK